MLEPIEKKNLGESAYQQIKKSILAGGLIPGEVVYEPRLAATLKVSRTPVREALIRLEQEGWVVPSPSGGYGFIVKSLSQKNIEDVYEMRILIESKAASYFAKIASESQLAELTGPLEEIAAEIELGRFSLFLSVHRKLHQIIIENCPNHLIRDTLLTLNERMVHIRSFTGYHPNRHARLSFAEHQEIVMGLVGRDTKSVEHSMTKHLEASLERVLSHMKEFGVLEQPDEDPLVTKSDRYHR